MSPLKPINTALIVFAKRPQLGQGKQRLARDIGDETGEEKALAVAEQLLQLTLEMVRSWTDALIISPSEYGDSEWACDLAKRAVIAIPQQTGSLGQRLEQIDREVRMLGYTDLIFIGTDAPLLTIEQLKQIKFNLSRYDQVFMPASDGGVIVMASRVPWSGLEQVNWSTEKVFMQLKSLAVQQGLSVQIRSEQTDLDDLQAYKVLKPLLLQSIEKQNKPQLTELISLLDKE